MQGKIRKYLEYVYEKEFSTIDEKGALDILSTTLREEVLAELNIKVLKQTSLLTTKFS